MLNKSILLSILSLWTLGMLNAQEQRSKGDKYFFAYSYSDAISEYLEEMKEAPLTNHQWLNLADSYYQTKKYGKALEIYGRIYEEDTIMSSHRFNKMLQSLSKTSQMDRIGELLKSDRAQMQGELVENANFNYELINTATGDNQVFAVRNVLGNSPQADFSTSFYRNGKVLFSSARPQKTKEVYGPSGESYLDIYEATMAENGDLINPTPFMRIPQSSYHKATPYYTEEGDKLFYILSNTEDDELVFDDKGKNALALGMKYGTGQFRFLLRDLSASFYYPFYDETSDILYFAANFEDGFGGTDLYYVRINNGQIMSSPVNLGPRVNSPGNEIAPYIFDNSLYFSSDVFYGFGGMDVYKSNIRTEGEFSIPVNLGSSINTKFDEFGLIIRKGSDETYEGYFSSNRDKGMGNDDIYAFRLTGTPGLKTLVVHGTVTNQKNAKGLSGASVTLLDGDGTVLRNTDTDTEGRFWFELPWRKELTVQVSKQGHSAFGRAYRSTTIGELSQPLQIKMWALSDLVVEAEGQNIIKLNDFYFPTGKSEITESIGQELDKVVEAIRKFPQMRIRIESHTDSKGNDRTNKKISQIRADAIRGYLLGKGVSASNISGAIGFGEERIMNNCKNGVYCLDFLHKKNRRIHFVIENLDTLGF